MSKCDYCGEDVAMHEIVDDDGMCGVSMLCDVCFSKAGGVFVEMTADRRLSIAARLVADADTGFRGMVEARHIEAAREVIFLVVSNPAIDTKESQ